MIAEINNSNRMYFNLDNFFLELKNNSSYHIKKIK